MTTNIPPEQRIPPDGMTPEEARIAARRNEPVRISPEVRETIITALRDALFDDLTELSQADIRQAIAFVEALP